VSVVGVAAGLKWKRSAREPQPMLTALPGRPPITRIPLVRSERTIPAHYSAVMSVAFTPDGERLLTASWDRTARIWNPRTAEPVAPLPGHTLAVLRIGVAPDGSRAVTVSDRTLRIWRLPEGTLERRIFVDPVQGHGLAIAPDSKTIATGGTRGSVRLWSMDGSAGLELSLEHGRVHAVAFSPDGTLLAAAGDDPAIRLWRVADGKLQDTLIGHTETVGVLAFSPDGQTLASAGNDHAARIWHVATAKPISTLSLHGDKVYAVAFAPNGGTLLTGGRDLVIGVWSMPSGKLRETVTLDPATKATIALAFAPDGATFASGHGGGHVGLWRLGQPRKRATVPRPTIAPTVPSADATPQVEAYTKAMRLIDAYTGDDAPLVSAEGELKRLLARDPRSALAHVGLARVEFKRAYRGRGDYATGGLARARRLADQALENDPKLGDAHVVRGWTLRASKDRDGARAALAEARRLAPASPRMLLLAAELAMDGGDIDGAENALRQALERPLDRQLAGSALGSLCDVYLQRGDLDADDEAHRAIIELEPESAWAKSNYAHFLLARGNPDGALTWAEAALQQMRHGAAETTLAEAHCAKGERLLWESGDAAAAAREFHAAANAASDHACAAYGLGAYHQYLGVAGQERTRLQEARRFYRQALMLDPRHALARRALAALGD
jgi:tetratricopeptide (TPR) repeat protein